MIAIPSKQHNHTDERAAERLEHKSVSKWCCVAFIVAGVIGLFAAVGILVVCVVERDRASSSSDEEDISQSQQRQRKKSGKEGDWATNKKIVKRLSTATFEDGPEGRASARNTQDRTDSGIASGISSLLPAVEDSDSV